MQLMICEHDCQVMDISSSFRQEITVCDHCCELVK